MRVRVLGSAAGGGVPQWNCGCSNCIAARNGAIPRRMVASLAVACGDGRWLLINATADVRQQLELLFPRIPQGQRAQPIACVLLTDANLDHVGGLLELRQAAHLRIYSTAAVRDMVAGDNRAFAMFAEGGHRWTAIDPGPERTPIDVDDCALRVCMVEVPGLVPSYAGGGPRAGSTVAYIIEDGTGACIAYAPIFLQLSAALEREIAGADAAFVDGSFWTDDELPALGLGARTARQMGHAPIAGAGGTLERLRASSVRRRFYTHINNSNPILDPDSAAARELSDAGIEIAQDGLELQLDGTARRHADTAAR